MAVKAASAGTGSRLPIKRAIHTIDTPQSDEEGKAQAAARNHGLGVMRDDGDDRDDGGLYHERDDDRT